MAHLEGPDEFITLARAAHLGGLQPKTLRDAAQQGRLQAIMPGTDYLTTRRHLHRYLAGRKRGVVKPLPDDYQTPDGEEPIRMTDVVAVPDDEHRAVHEAGHAVVAYCLGREVLSVTIEDTEQEGEGGKVVIAHGFTSIARFWMPQVASTRDWERVEREIMIYYGGLVAEDLLLHERSPEWATNDIICAQSYLPLLMTPQGLFSPKVEANEAEKDACLRWLEYRCRCLLARSSSLNALRRLRTKLQHMRTLSGDEVRATISDLVRQEPIGSEKE